MFSFMQNLGCFDRIHWAKSWTNGQNRGQKVVEEKGDSTLFNF
jgi:hypothetical protein